MLLRGFGPHLHPRLESSGVVWGRPSPPALGSAESGLPSCSSRGLSYHGGVGRTRGSPNTTSAPVPIRSPPVEVAPRWNVPAPAGCCCSTSTIGFAKADPGVRGALGLLYPVALGRVG